MSQLRMSWATLVQVSIHEGDKTCCVNDDAGDDDPLVTVARFGLLQPAYIDCVSLNKLGSPGSSDAWTVKKQEKNFAVVTLLHETRRGMLPTPACNLDGLKLSS